MTNRSKFRVGNIGHGGERKNGGRVKK